MNSPESQAQPNRFQRSFHVVAKPIGSLCNLDCTYCYYRHKEELLPETAGGPMDDELLEEFIRQYIAAQEVDWVVFNWHGGEPALLGLDLYSHVCNGECPKNRFLRTPDGEPGLNYLCPGHRRFFAHAAGHLRQLADRLRPAGS